MKRLLVFAGAFAALLFAAGAHAETIAELQAKIDAAGAHWTAGETSMSRLSFAEAAARCTLPLMSLEAPSSDGGEAAATDMPAHWDWRDMNGKNYLTSIKDQDPCGACQTFSSIGAFEANFKIVMNNDFIQPDFSEQQVFSCDGEGLLPYTLFGPLIYLRDHGAADDACDPFRCTSEFDREPCANECGDWQTRSHRIAGYQFLMFPSVDAMKALLQNGPFVAGFEVYEDFQNYTGGVYQHVSGPLLGGHAVVVVGYDDAGEYWIAKNSWSEKWGEAGYFRIKWGMCGIMPFGFQSAALSLDRASICDGAQAPKLSRLTLSSTTLAADENLGVGFAWHSANATVAGGELWYSIDGAPAVRYGKALIELTGTSSGEDKVVYELAGPFAGGRRTIAVQVKDICGLASNAVTATFEVAGGADDDDDNDAADDDVADDDAADDDAADDDATPTHHGSSSGGGCGG